MARVILDYFDAKGFHRKETLRLLNIIEQLVTARKVCEASVVARLLDPAYYGGGPLLLLRTVLPQLCANTPVEYTLDDVLGFIQRAKEQVIE